MGRVRSIPGISFVQGFAVFLTEPPVFGLEIILPVVFRLIPDVGSDDFNMGATHAERAVTRLPCETPIPIAFRFDPRR